MKALPEKAPRMRIVFLMPTYYPDTFGGVERQTRILARAMLRRGVGTTILTPALKRNDGGTVDEAGVTVVRIPVKRHPFLGGRYLSSMLWWWLRAFAWLAWHRGSYDVIAIQHVRLHAAPGLLAGMLFGKILSGKLGRGGSHFELRRLLEQTLPFGRLVVAMAKWSRLVFVANSSEIAHDLLLSGIPARRIARVPNGVECPAEPLADYRDARRRQLFVYAGRLSNEKGVTSLAAAFKDFATPGRPVTLSIFGAGPLWDGLQRAAGEPSLSERMLVRHVTDDRDVIYRQAAFMVLPSETEGMSNTLLEAMAYGVVPIITNVSGVGDIVVDGETGFILDGNDPASIRRGLDRASAIDADRWQAMSLAVRRRMVDGFSIETVADAYLSLYAGLHISPAYELPSAAIGRIAKRSLP